MNQLKRKILFPTAVYFKDIPNAKELNKYLFKEIKKWRKADPEGEKKTNSGFGWHSKTDMDKRQEYRPLIDELFKMAYECNKDFGIEVHAIAGRHHDVSDGEIAGQILRRR